MQDKIKKYIFSDNFIYLVMGNKRKKSQDESKVEIRLIENDKNKIYQISTYIDKKVFHKNINENHILEEILNLITDKFKQINIFTVKEDVQVLANKVDKPKFIIASPTKNISDKKKNYSHNKTKNYLIPDGEKCDFLIYLGIMNKDGKILKNHYNKFRQINRFLEILMDAIRNSKVIQNKISAGNKIKIIDFGCGKSYLTFAIYYLLVKKLNMNVEIIGID